MKKLVLFMLLGIFVFFSLGFVSSISILSGSPDVNETIEDKSCNIADDCRVTSCGYCVNKNQRESIFCEQPPYPGPLISCTCENNICISSVEKPKTCAEEGEQFSRVDTEYPERCCAGLAEWNSGMDTRRVENGECIETGLESGNPVGTCIKCGDGICGAKENICNCPADCRKHEEQCQQDSDCPQISYENPSIISKECRDGQLCNIISVKNRCINNRCRLEKQYGDCEQCQYGCIYSKCAKPCEDIDGVSPYFYSKIFVNGTYYNEDVCSSENKLTEWICDGDNPKSIEYECINGCYKGTCIFSSFEECPQSGAEGKNGKAVQYKQSNCLSIFAKENQNSESWTISAWVKPDKPCDYTIYGWGCAILTKDVVGESFYRTLSVARGKQKFEFIYTKADKSVNSGNVIVEANSNFEFNNWYHLVLTYNSENNEFNFYINGQLDRNEKVGMPILKTKETMRIGCRTTHEEDGFSGNIDDAGFWNKALSPEEVSRLYNNEAEIKEEGVFYFAFDEEAGKTEFYDIKNENKASCVIGEFESAVQPPSYKCLEGGCGIPVKEPAEKNLIEPGISYEEYKNKIEKTKECELIGLRKEGRYCTDEYKWKEQAGDNEKCDNNFECESNVCVSDECVSEGLLKKILDWFRNIFG